MTIPRYNVKIEPLPLMAAFDARGKAEALLAALARTGMAPALERGRVVDFADGMQVMRPGPGRVILLAPMALEAQIEEALAKAFAEAEDADFALVSDMLAAFQVSGPGALDVLRQGAALDLSREALPPGSAAATDLWSVSALILRVNGAAEALTVIVERSFAGYIENWLMTAAGLPSDLKPAVMAAGAKAN